MLEQFLTYLEFQKRYSSHTVTSYRNDLTQFFEFAAQPVEDIGHQHIRSWIMALGEDGYAARTINRKISALKTFYKFLLQEGAVDHNPLQKIITPKQGKTLPSFVPEHSMRDLLDTCAWGDDFADTRDKFMLELLYSTGIRVSELIGIEERDVDFTRNQLKVLGKRNKERLVPLTAPLVDMCSTYLEQKKLHIEGQPYVSFLFITDKGKQMYPRFVYTKVRKYLSEISNVAKKSPHVLRHTFATHMLNNGADINAIKEILGHSSLAATQVYTHNSIDKLKSIHERAHPKGRV